jgi:uncharacterized protein with ACT and thioredoxin-like domain
VTHGYEVVRQEHSVRVYSLDSKGERLKIASDVVGDAILSELCVKFYETLCQAAHLKLVREG